MKKIVLVSVAILTAAAAGAWYFFLREPSFKTTGGYLVNVDKSGLIIEGYDPVSYFLDNKPVKGNPQFSTRYQAATYWFASDEHRSLFNMEPRRYAPQYGGFCGYAVSLGKLRPVDPAIYQIENGRLILQHTRQAFNLFNKDLKGNLVLADKNWPVLVQSHSGKVVEYDQPAQAPATSPR